MTQYQSTVDSKFDRINTKEGAYAAFSWNIK